MNRDGKSGVSGQINPVCVKGLAAQPSFAQVFSVAKSPKSRPESKIPNNTPTCPLMSQRFSGLPTAQSELKFTKKKKEKKSPKKSQSKNSPDPGVFEKSPLKFKNETDIEHIQKLEIQVRYYKSLVSQSPESEKLLQIIENQTNEIAYLQNQLKLSKPQKSDKHKKLISELKSDNISLIEKLGHFRELLEKSRLKYEKSKKEKNFFCEELEKLKNQNKGLPAGALGYFVQDIWKIRREVGKLKRLVEDLHEGKELSLKGLLGIDVEQFKDPPLQIAGDLLSIKSDLNRISNVISDVHASNCAEIMCKPQ